MRIGIVADDLTGAADAVAPFAMRGLSSAVSRGMFPGTVDCTPDALALNSSTRDWSNVRPTIITSTVRRATRRLLECKRDLIYKKIDSTLRGFLRLELDAMRKELPGRLAVICPSFPANGRTVEQGILSVSGVPQRRVRAAFEYEPDESAAEISLETLRQGEDNLASLLDRLTLQGISTLFCDATHPSDLQILAEALIRLPERILPVGSAGLSGAIAAAGESGDEKEAEFAREKARDAFRKGKVLILVGSQHSASRRQAAVLAERAGITPVSDLNEGARQLQSGQRIALILLEYEARHMMFFTNFFELQRALIDLPDLCLIATGGDTAASLMSYALYGCRGVTILGESHPGIVFGRLQGTNFPHKSLNGVPIMLKAGGFGDEETLARCVGLA